MMVGERKYACRWELCIELLNATNGYASSRRATVRRGHVENCEVFDSAGPGLVQASLIRLHRMRKDNALSSNACNHPKKALPSPNVLTVISGTQLSKSLQIHANAVIVGNWKTSRFPLCQ